jgi:hypothetical protein
MGLNHLHTHLDSSFHRYTCMPPCQSRSALVFTRRTQGQNLALPACLSLVVLKFLCSSMNTFSASASFIYREFGLGIWIFGWHMLRGLFGRRCLSLPVVSPSFAPFRMFSRGIMVLVVAQPAFPALQYMGFLPVQAKETKYICGWCYRLTARRSKIVLGQSSTEYVLHRGETSTHLMPDMKRFCSRLSSLLFNRAVAVDLTAAFQMEQRITCVSPRRATNSNLLIV